MWLGIRRLDRRLGNDTGERWGGPNSEGGNGREGDMINMSPLYKMELP